MRIREITGKDFIIQDLRAELRSDALRELVALVASKKGLSPLEREAYLAEVFQRHDRVPSGLWRGLAFPNARIADLKEPVLAIGISRKGLDFHSRDGKPSYVIFLYLGRANPPDDERRMLSRLSSAMADPRTAEALNAAVSADEVWEAILAIDAEEKVGAC